MIYLDNAATSWPKPEQVYVAADTAFRNFSGNPGRSGHKLSLAASRRIEETRLLAARLFNIPKPESLSFTLNATDSLNLALKGVLCPGDHIITSSMEHNAVARPLEALKEKGIEYTKVPVSPLNGANLDDIRSAIKKNTKLIVWCHVSNVCGTINPIEEIGAIARERGILFLVDAAQSAGIFPIDVQKMNIDLLAFPGHKGLLGPQGTGGLYVREGLILSPLREGGTGSRSEELTQPPNGPDRYESGTQNTAGIAALGAGIQFILDEGIENIHAKEARLASRLIDGLSGLPGLRLYGPPAGLNRSGVVSLTLDSMDSAQVATILDQSFDIAVRSGLHCAPDAHRTLGTLTSGGTIRISAGYLNTDEDIDRCIHALKLILEEGVM
jgi:cysteine desulfurase family protein